MNDVWLPSHYKRNIVNVTDEIRRQWRRYVDLCEAETTWGDLAKTHYRVKVRLPRGLIDEAKRDYSGKLFVYLYPTATRRRTIPLYYAEAMAMASRPCSPKAVFSLVLATNGFLLDHVGS